MINPPLNRELCVAPMMKWTDRHCRRMLRLFAPNAHMYTEMVTTGALIHGPRSKLLEFTTAEQPLAIQLGGSDPKDLATCARMAEIAGFVEVNLNVGCPSVRVKKGAFGAVLMKAAPLVSECIKAMQDAVKIPVTIKCRLGVDELDSQEFLFDFIGQCHQAGCTTFIVHARKAYLNGISPAENRDIPPLQPERVYALKEAFKQCQFIMNGGLKTVQQVLEHNQKLDGSMLGRAAYQDPWTLCKIEHALFATPMPDHPSVVVKQLIPYIESELAQGVRLHQITRHMMGIFNGLPGARAFRRTLSDFPKQNQPSIRHLHGAIDQIMERAA